MKRLGILLLFWVNISGIFIHAQTKIQVIEYNEQNAQKEAKAVFDQYEKGLTDEGYSGKALFWELAKHLFEQYEKRYKKEIVNPEELTKQLQVLTDSITKMRNELSGMVSLSKQLTDLNLKLSVIQPERDSLKKQLVAYTTTEQKIKNKDKEIAQLKQQRILSDSIVKFASFRTRELENQLKQLSAFKSMVESKTGDFNKVFSKAETNMQSVSRAEIQDALQKMSVILSDLPETEQIRAEQLKNVYLLIESLNRATVAMKQPFDGGLIAKLKSEITVNRKWAWTEEQKAEVEQILTPLTAFESCTKGFESVIDNVMATLDMFKWDAPERRIPTMLQEIDYKVRDRNPQAAVENGDYGICYELINKQLADLRNRIEKGERAPNVKKEVLTELRKSVRKQK